MTRALHPPQRGVPDERDRFDPIVEGARYDLPADQALALWDRVIGEATGRTGEVNGDAARRRFHELAARLTVFAIGRSTRVETELGRGPARRQAVALAAPAAPGRTTRVEASSWASIDAVPTSTAARATDDPAATRDDTGRAGPTIVAASARPLDADPWIRTLLGRGSGGRPGMALQVLAGSAVGARSAGPTREVRIARDIEPGAAAIAPGDLAALLPAIDDVRGGTPLPAALARQLAGKLGVDLARVRIHTDARAARLSAELSARAFAVGDDIYFARGAYDPDSATGRALIAHEVMHVVQNARGEVPDTGRVVSSPDDAHERQADAFARRFAAEPDRPVAAERSREIAPAAALPSARGGAARIDRSPNPAGSDRMWDQLFHGGSVPVGKLARVSAPLGIRLRSAPGGAKGPDVITFGELMHVERTTPEPELAKRWAYVIATGSGSSGFVEEKFLAIDPPDPEATLHLVAPHEQLGQIAERVYGEHITGGNDARLYVQALYEANKSRPGIKLQPVSLSWKATWHRREAEEETLKVYRGVQILGGQAIWIPSEAFVQRLKASGAISSGSSELSKAWREAKEMGAAVVEFVKFNAGVVVGILEGAWQALVDVFKGAWELVKMAFEVLKAYLTGTLLKLMFDTAKKVKAFFEKLDVGQTVKALGQYISDKWTSAGWYGRGEFIGQVVGYIALNVLLLVATEGGSIGALLAEAAAAGSDIARAVMALIKVVDVAQNPLKLLEGAGKAVTIPEEIAAKLKQGVARDGAAAAKVERGARDASKAVEHGGAGKVADQGAGRHGPEIKSGVSEPPDPLLRGGELSARQLELENKLAASADKMITIGKREVTATDLAALTRSTGLEHAIVILHDDTRALVQMGSYKGGRLPANTKRLLMHSHPTDWGSGMAKFISAEDIEAIITLKQEYSYMVTVDGTVYKFTTKTMPMSIGEVVRELHPYKGWVGGKK